MGAAASTITLGTTDYASLTTDKTSTAGPFGALSGYGEGFGLGCVDSRYCDIGSFAVFTTAGQSYVSLDTQRLSFTKVLVSSVLFGGDTVMISARTLLEIYDPDIDFETYVGMTPPPKVTVTKVNFTFGNLTDNQSTAFGDPFYDSTATAKVEYVTAVPVPASGLMIVSGLLLLVRRRKAA